jgi:feruloyl-CoA synthase
MTSPGAPTFAAPDIALEPREDGSMLLQSRDQLGPYANSVAEAFRACAAAHPDRLLASQRGADDELVTLTYGEARARADALAQAFLDLGLGPDRPIMILSGNSLEHLTVALGAYTAGIPFMPISVAYSTLSTDHARLTAITELTKPGLVFADDADQFGPALDAVSGSVDSVVIARGVRAGALRLEDLLRTAPTAALETAFAAIGPDTVAKLLFTSGSTGSPKGVINTHRMLCSNQAMILHVWPFLESEPPVMVDWLPWSHTFGGNHNLNLALFNGGTVHIDDGRPAPNLFDRTLSGLRELTPSVYFAVPASYALLAPALEADRELAERFFSRLRFMFYAAAALPDELALRLRRIASEVADHDIPLTSGWGLTETAPTVTYAHFSEAVVGCIGVPVPGTTVKLAPVDDKLEIRVKGPNVTPGYFAQPALTEAAFDEEGFFRTGDAVKPVDETDPNKGLFFDGRIAEDFKLTSGTFVRVGALRPKLIGAAAVLSDAVIAGQDKEFVTAMAWLNQAEARKLTGSDDDVALDHPVLRKHLSATLTQFNQGSGSASRVERLLILTDPPSLDDGEITDKGSINQRKCLTRRAEDVARLYADDPDPAIVLPSA